MLLTHCHNCVLTNVNSSIKTSETKFFYSLLVVDCCAGQNLYGFLLVVFFNLQNDLLQLAKCVFIILAPRGGPTHTIHL